MKRQISICSLMIVAAFAGFRSVLADDGPGGIDYFEREVRPILVDVCQKCHDANKHQGDLRLDSREAILKGGSLGSAIDPGHPEKSLLIAAIRHEGDVHMPPKQKLEEAQITALAHWVKLGAPWPATTALAVRPPDAARNHWAFQPLQDPPVPVVAGNDSPNPIDAFLRERLAREKLFPAAISPPADKRTMYRRASFTLTGLPPAPDEVARFEADSDPLAYERLIDRLLDSPHYGEHWGRHWLDVARYSDSKGYVYAREQRFWLHAWVYRDWVVQALNRDLPYDRFLLMQIAADQAAPDDKTQLAAMGFLTVGRRFLGVQRDIIDDRIDVVMRGTLGLTVGCARCHDHKYDPIPTRDYYSLYGVFQSCSERIESIAEPAVKDDASEKFEAELNKRRKKLSDTLSARRHETAERVRRRAGDYLAAQLELHKYPEEGFDQVLAKGDLLPTFVRVWKDYLAAAKLRNDPVFVPWHAFSELPPREFAARAPQTVKALAALPAGRVHPQVLRQFETPPASMPEVARRYGELFATALHDGADESLKAILFGELGPCSVPDEPIVNIENYVDSDTCNELWKVQNELDQWILQAPAQWKHAAILVDRAVPSSPRIFKRGNPANLGDEVPRKFVSVIAGDDSRPFAHGSGRLELARAIVDPKNPLTARVIVNRVWAFHFGTGLVPTPSDFGTRAGLPSHPELLDWLSARFMADGWSLKKLHRRILTSQAFRQSSTGPASADYLAAAMQKDPENRWLWRMNEHRLSFEELRDSVLATTGRLDRAVGGKPGDLALPNFSRRTLYGSIDRQFFPTTLRLFDFANPDLHIPQRNNTSVPQQALYFLNHPLMVGYAQQLASATATVQSDEARVQAMFRAAYQRAATPEQVAAALAFVKQASSESPPAVPATSAQWHYGFGAVDEQAHRVKGFTKLPHFTGGAWQGGVAFPDAKLGWVQLSAAGGHPGDDLAHAAVRRWQAPRDGKVTIRSTLIHEPEEGEGVRAFIVTSRGGILAKAKVHHAKAELGAKEIELKAGDTVDFVVDIGKKLSYNQFLWTSTIAAADGATWESQRDFAGQATTLLGPWEQLAQVILSANEFTFVD